MHRIVFSIASSDRSCQRNQLLLPDDHQVRAISAVLDLSWVYGELSPHYPVLGRPSIDPVLMIRMLILGRCGEPEALSRQRPKVIAEHDDPTMFARIGMMRALNHGEPKPVTAPPGTPFQPVKFERPTI